MAGQITFPTFVLGQPNATVPMGAGSVFVAIQGTTTKEVPASAVLQSGNNLSDIPNAALARSNLGVSTAVGLEWTTTVVISNGTTCIAFVGYPVDSSGGAFSITAPASPAAGTQFGIADCAGALYTNNVTLLANGNKFPNPGASPTVHNVILSTPNKIWIWTYINSTYGWIQQ